MNQRVFPLKRRQKTLLDGLSRSDAGRAFSESALGIRPSGPVRSEVISRGRRVSVASFPGDSLLYSGYAVDVLGQKPAYLDMGVRTVDGLRLAGFSGVASYRRRSFAISMPTFAVPDFSSVRELEERIRVFGEDLSTGLSGFRLGISSGRTAYAPLVGAMVLGMASALFLEHSFGSGVQADDQVRYVPARQPLDARVLGESTETNVDTDKVLLELTKEDPGKKEFEDRVREMVKGYPIEDMLPYIFEQDRTVAIYLIAIAKKESGWGTHVPLLDGQDCFNEWGYRGIRKMMGTGGHTCFNSRKDAVETVAKRLHTLIYDKNLTTPADLIVWKCGNKSCTGQDPYGVAKWKSDVDLYVNRLSGGDDGKG